MPNRRRLLLSALPVVAGFTLGSKFAAAFDGGDKAAHFAERIAELEQASGGQLGVSILDTATGVQYGHRQDERFPMCSTSKLLIAAAVLARVDQAKDTLGRVVQYSQKDILAYSPGTQPRLGSGMSVAELCTAALTLSDNTAANLLLASIGGPAGFNAFVRVLGDETTRLDRTEPDLNQATPGDPRDTTTPAAMVSNLRALLLGSSLTPTSAAQLKDWLLHNTTGDKRLRAGLPADWTVGDKTGSGAYGTSNDVAILWPPKRAPILASVYLTNGTLDDDHRNETIAAVAREIPTLFELPLESEWHPLSEKP